MRLQREKVERRVGEEGGLATSAELFAAFEESQSDEGAADGLVELEGLSGSRSSSTGSVDFS